MLHANGFANVLTNRRRFGFDVDSANTANQLRELARLIETGVVLVQNASVLSLAKLGEYTSTLLRLKLVEKQPLDTDAEAEKRRARADTLIAARCLAGVPGVKLEIGSA